MGAGDRHLTRAVNLAGGRGEELTDATTSVAPGAGVGFVYEDVQGPAIARIAGPSAYDAPDDDRYAMRVVLVVGDDYRIQSSSESIYFEPVMPPENDGEPIEPNQEEEPFEMAYAASFSSADATSPPLVKAQVADSAKENIAWQDYQGFWRGAVVIDFGKDLPGFVEARHALPEVRLRRALGARLFPAGLAEAGEFIERDAMPSIKPSSNFR